MKKLALGLLMALAMASGAVAQCVGGISQDRMLVNLKSRRSQVDEAWAFCYAKQKNVAKARAAKGAGDIWTWVGIDVDTKLVASWYVGRRDSQAAMTFMDDLAPRLANRVQAAGVHN
jgi:hypothetical protein